MSLCSSILPILQQKFVCIVYGSHIIIIIYRCISENNIDIHEYAYGKLIHKHSNK